MATVQETLLSELDYHFSLTQQIETIMATQQEVAAQINAFTTQLGKVNSEIQQKIADLTNAAGNDDTVSAELQAAIDGLQVSVQALDDIVPDAPIVDVPGEEVPVEEPVEEVPTEEPVEEVPTEEVPTDETPIEGGDEEVIPGV